MSAGVNQMIGSMELNCGIERIERGERDKEKEVVKLSSSADVYIIFLERAIGCMRHIDAALSSSQLCVMV